MRLRTRAALLAVLAMTVVSCDDDSPRASPPFRPSPPSVTPSATFSPPPLALPTVGPGAPCPVTRPQRWSKPFGVATNVLGDGPLYPIADYFRSGSATLELRPDDRRPDGTFEKKVRWLGVGYVGPVVLRAGRIDGPGTASARFAYFGTPSDDGFTAELTALENDLPATTTVSGPGCYAYQVDGTSFRTTIVFRAVAAP